MPDLQMFLIWRVSLGTKHRWPTDYGALMSCTMEQGNAVRLKICFVMQGFTRLHRAVDIGMLAWFVCKELLMRKVEKELLLDSWTLLDKIMKISSTAERRIRVDIFRLMENHEPGELKGTGWNRGKENPANVFRKKVLLDRMAKEVFMKGNKLNIEPVGWAMRKGERHGEHSGNKCNIRKAERKDSNFAIIEEPYGSKILETPWYFLEFEASYSTNYAQHYEEFSVKIKLHNCSVFVIQTRNFSHLLWTFLRIFLIKVSGVECKNVVQQLVALKPNYPLLFYLVVWIGVKKEITITTWHTLSFTPFFVFWY